MALASRTLSRRSRGVKRGADAAAPLKRQLQARGLTYKDIARLAGVSWWMVYAVINGRRTSDPVMSAIRKLLGGVHATR